MSKTKELIREPAVDQPETFRMSALPGFLKWAEDNLCEIEAVQGLLKEQLNDNPAILAEELTKIEAWQGRVLSLLADANAFLDLAERANLPARDQYKTDLDRGIALAAAVVQERRIRDILQGLTDTVKSRLMLGMALMKRNAGERTDWAS